MTDPKIITHQMESGVSAAEACLRTMIRITIDKDNKPSTRAEALEAITKLSLTQFELQRNYPDIDRAITETTSLWKKEPAMLKATNEFRAKMSAELAVMDAYHDHPVVHFWRDVVNHSQKTIIFSPVELNMVVKLFTSFAIGSFDELLMIEEEDMKKHSLVKDSERCKFIIREFYKIANVTKLTENITLGDYRQPMGYLPIPVSWPTAFEVAEAWSPAAKDKYGCRPSYVAEMRKCFALQEDDQRFNITKAIQQLGPRGAEERCRFAGHRGIPITVQRAYVRNFQRSLAGYASHLRGYGTFCVAKNAPQLPPRKDVIELFCSTLKSSAYVTGAIAAITNACDFLACPKDGLQTEIPKHIADGLKKYRQEKVTTFFTTDQIQLMINSSLQAARFVAGQQREETDFGRLAMEFSTAVLMSFIFQIRFASEGHRIQLSITDDEETEMNGRLRVLAKPPTPPARIILKLARRKNRQSVKKAGHQVIRFCSCDPNTPVYQTEFTRERNKFSKKVTHDVKIYPAFRGQQFCPYHRIWVMAQGLIQDKKVQGNPVSERVFGSMSPRVFTMMLKRVVANEYPRLGKVEAARIHGFRKSGTQANAATGLRGIHLMDSGDWKSAAIENYVKKEVLEATSFKKKISESDEDTEDDTMGKDDEFLRSQLKMEVEESTKETTLEEPKQGSKKILGTEKHQLLPTRSGASSSRDSDDFVLV